MAVTSEWLAQYMIAVAAPMDRPQSPKEDTRPVPSRYLGTKMTGETKNKKVEILFLSLKI